LTISLTNDLSKEYQLLFDTCEIRPQRQPTVEKLVGVIAQNKDRYRTAGKTLGIPWFFIGAIHNMESSLRFDRHLHNGDPLTARTTHVPNGRPKAGDPPFTWEESATDALQLEGLDKVKNWTIPGILFQMEKYNGFGYRTKHPEVLTPYLWSASNLYSKGKFTADGKFDPDATSQQCGAAVLLRRMSETGIVTFDADGDPNLDFKDTPAPSIESYDPLVTFSATDATDVAKTLQRALNALPGIFLRVDGVAGIRTSDAFKKVTGHFLTGDPRAQVATG
jgi:lysozyme family protein